jgi:hypothetical protein
LIRHDCSLCIWLSLATELLTADVPVAAMAPRTWARPEKSAAGFHFACRATHIEDARARSHKEHCEKRLAQLFLANFGKERRLEPIVGKFSRETLAEMIGATRSRVSNFMNKFRDLGFISYNGSIEVHSSLLSVLLHDKKQLIPNEGMRRLMSSAAHSAGVLRSLPFVETFSLSSPLKLAAFWPVPSRALRTASAGT